MVSYYSRYQSSEEKRSSRKAFLMIFASIALLVLLVVFGLPLSAKVASFFSGLKSGNNIAQITDTTPPGPPNLANLPEATNQQNLEIKGTAEPEATVILSVNDQLFDSLTDKDGNFVFNVALNKGDNTLFAKAKDPAGNESQPSPNYKVTYDNEAPKLDISSPKDGDNFYGAKQRLITIQGTTKPGSDLTANDRLVRLNDDGTFSYQFNLSVGDNTLNFSVTDASGNKTNKSITLHYFE